MQTSTAENWGIVDSRSFGSFGRPYGKTKVPLDCRSQPFGKPYFSLFREIKTHLKIIAGWSFLKGGLSKNPLSQTPPTSQSPSLDESKVIIRELSTHLSKISKNQDHLTNSHEDDYSLAECQQFILRWAEELTTLPKTSVGECRTSPSCRGSWEEYLEDERTSPEKAKRRLEEAQRVVSSWSAGLLSRKQDSVCPGVDVCAVLQDLERQWKRGKLPNMLPVMDFIIWSVLQELPQEGSIPQLWLKSKQRFKHTASITMIPEPVWGWIRKASVDIVLDPESAHPAFIMSKDKKCVRVGKVIESEYDPSDGSGRTPHKYDGWWCALGTEGFTSGRYYWEVGVERKKDWRIGVVRESAPRNGFSDLNTRTGYWALRMQVAGLKALTVPAVDIQKPEDLRKIGVYLDMEEGQLSFYDAVRCSHIFTFNATFSEKVYPIFGTVETDTDLTIM